MSAPDANQPMPQPKAPPPGHRTPRDHTPADTLDPHGAATPGAVTTNAVTTNAATAEGPHAKGAHGASVGDVHVGRIVTATVAELTDHEIVLKMVDGRPGVLMLRDAQDADGARPSVGDTIEVALLAREDPHGRVATSRGWAVQQQAWERIETARAADEPLRVTVTRQVKGGLLVDLGPRTFLPASEAFEERDGTLADLVGTEVEVVVTEADRDKDRVVVSRRSLLRRRRRAEERAAYDRLEVGSRVTGRVVAMTDYGAMVDLAGARGLLHRSEMSWNRLRHMADHAVPGQELDLLVIEVNRAKRRIGLSLRQLADDPLANVSEGTVSDAVISRVVDYGAFAMLPSGLEGLVHLSEMAEGRGFRPEELVAPGEAVRVMVVGIDRKRRRLELSMTQAAMAPAPPPETVSDTAGSATTDTAVAPATAQGHVADAGGRPTLGS